MKKQKIAIIGAGICGLYLGWKLAEKGHYVKIFEKKGEIGNSACSGLFSERILKHIPEAQNLIKNTIDSAKIHFPKKTITLNFSKRFFVISHFKLDRLVAKKAREAGAKINLSNQISKIPEGFDIVIGCDGPTSTIRQSLDLPNPDFRLGILGYEERENFDNFVDTWPVKNGFLWKIPRKENTEFGVASDVINAKIYFGEFLKQNNIRLSDRKAKLIPQGLIIPKNKSVTLLGDAAGLTKPWSGGGVIWGLTACDILSKNFPNLLKFRKEAQKFFSFKIMRSKIITKLVYFFGFNLPWLLPKKVKIESDYIL